MEYLILFYWILKVTGATCGLIAVIVWLITRVIILIITARQFQK